MELIGRLNEWKDNVESGACMLMTWFPYYTETEEELIGRLNEWKDNVESGGMRESV